MLAIKKFGSVKGLLLKANPDSQLQICKHTSLCFFGNYPTLSDLSMAFTNKAPVMWLVPQLFNLSEFCGCKEKLSVPQLEQCAKLIAQNYNYLKITELMLFFYRFKTARYGRFYGTVDPLVIMSALKVFITERNEAYCAKEQDRQEKIETKSMQRCISWEEYCKNHNIRNRKSPLERINVNN